MATIKELKSDKGKFKSEPTKYVEITNLLGHKYREIGRYEEAIEEHHEAIEASKKIKQIAVAREYEAASRRALGECYSEMGRHEEAKGEHDAYLSLSEGLNEPIEVQRAHATIGRTYLLWAQDTDQALERSLLFKSAASFKKALELCETLMSSGKLKSREYAEMKSRLLLNLGLVYEILSDFDKCKKLLLVAIELTKSNFLNDDLFRCQISLGSIYEKINLLNEALHSYEEALQTAKLLKSKTKRCDALLCLGLIMMKLEDIEKCRHYFKKAFLLKSPVEEDKQRAERFLKIASVIRDDLLKLSKCAQASDQIISTCDRLADHFVEMKCYSISIKYYKEQLLQARLANKPNSVLAKIYVSIGQTYCDELNYERAIHYFTQEYELCLTNKCEQCASLLKIAELQESQYESIDELDADERAHLNTNIIHTYEKALQLFDTHRLMSAENNDLCELNSPSDYSLNPKERRKLIRTIKNYLNFLEARKSNPEQQSELRARLSRLNYSGDEEEERDEGTLIEIGDDNEDLYDQYNIDSLSSDSDNCNESDEETPANFHSRHKRNPNASKVNRLNQFGETPLHTACIAGNIAQVERLIEQKAPLNSRDYCGWTPLHEACNHGHSEIVELLLKSGANIEACDDRSERITPLHDSCNCGHLSIIRLLLKCGASVLAVNAKNETPVECLMSWRKRSENELSDDNLEECLALEKEMLAAMKDKGHDLNNLQYQTRSSSHSQSSKRDVLPVNRQRNLVGEDIYLDKSDLDRAPQTESKPNRKPDYDDPGTARHEYQSTITKLRRAHLAPRLAKLDTRDRPEKAALLGEDEITPRDDWLVSDFSSPDKTKKRQQALHFDVPNRKKQKCDTAQPEPFKSFSKQVDDSSDDHEHENEQSVVFCPTGNEDNSETDLYPQSPLTTTIELSDDAITLCPITATTLSPVKLSRSARDLGELTTIEPEEPQYSSRVAIVQFDDAERSSFAVPISQMGLTFRDLVDQLKQRYFQKYNVKPIISLFTTEGAILSEEDLVSDFIEVKQNFKAVIESWTVEPAQNLYTELCKQSDTKPHQGLVNVLRAFNTSGTLNINSAFIASRMQATLMLKSLFRQEVKELNLSYTSVMSDKENIDCFFNMLSTLPTLQVLNLSGTAFPKNYLINLLNISPILRQLDLSFNSIGDESAYVLSQLINMYDKLRYLNLSGCDLTRKLIRSKLVTTAIEDSNLASVQLDYNNIESDLVAKFKTLNVNKSFLTSLAV